MAKHRAKGKALHIAYLDISKAYDTVNHKQLWHVCQSYGIMGKWLENLQRLYEGTRIRSLTSQGPTEEVEMKSGIRQGCPLSPVLFALYIQPIAEALQETMADKSRQESGKPNMLFYADDMVLWGESKAELAEKMKTVIGTMEQLGLQVSTSKT